MAKKKTKRCAKCKRYKPREEFHPCAKASDKLQYWCKKCMLENRLQYFKDNKDKEVARNRRNRHHKRAQLYKWLSDKSCADCGISDPRVLQFDHVRGEKIGNIANLINKWCFDRVLKEISKCEIRCANCHQIKTSEEAGWYKYMNGDG